MKPILHRYGCLLFFLLFIPNLNAQQLPLTLYSSREGAPLAGALSVFQDKQGGVWFVNGYDVVRYDGYRFKSYPPSAQTKLSYVFGLMEVKDEKWILGYGKPMRISGDSIEVIPTMDPSLDFQYAIMHDKKTYLLEQRGLYLYDKDSLKRICR